MAARANGPGRYWSSAREPGERGQCMRSAEPRFLRCHARKRPIQIARSAAMPPRREVGEFARVAPTRLQRIPALPSHPVDEPSRLLKRQVR